MGRLARRRNQYAHSVRIRCRVHSHGPGYFAHRPHRIRRADRAARTAAEAWRGSSSAAAMLVSGRRSLPMHLRYTVADGDRPDGSPGGSVDGTGRRAVLHLVAQIEAEELVAIILVGGGARSGKSRYALELARLRGPRLVFLATAEPLDREMEERIAKHRADRAPEFTTIEEPLKIADAICKADADAIVVDCLTLWLSNVMLSFGH